MKIKITYLVTMAFFDYYKKMVPTDQVTSAFILNKNVIHE